MDEEKSAMSGPKARKAVLFKRAVLKNRRKERAVPREPDGAGEQTGTPEKSGVRAQQMRIKAAFGDADAA